ncbi:MAG: Hsp20 family protein [Myxococcota bacterium]|nr:Hsp20 family protein [Myxococcota bacterium]
MLSILNRHPLQIIQRELQAQRHSAPQNRDASWLLTVDIREAQDHFILFADIPGVGPEDLHIEVEEDVLTLNVKRVAAEETSSNELRRERSQGECKRSFRLSERIAKDGIEAQVKNGVLRLTLPKIVPLSPTPITVNFH